MKKLLCMVLLIALSISMVACGGSNTESGGDAAADSYELVFAHISNEDTSWHKAAVNFKETVEEKSEGRITVKIYPNNTLGSESEVLEMIQTGTCDMTITADNLSAWAPDLGFMATPYMIQDYDHLEAVVDGEVGQTIESEILDKAGMRCLTWFARGPRYLTSTLRVETPADLAKVVIRVPDVPMYVKTWESLGAKPVPMALSEVFTSVQQGTINAQENPLALVKSSGFSEVFPYCMETEHVRGWIYTVISEKKFQSLPEDLQVIVQEAADEMQNFEREVFLADEERLRTELEAEGMEFVPVDKGAFEEKAKGVLNLLTESQLALYEKAVSLR